MDTNEKNFIRIIAEYFQTKKQEDILVRDENGDIVVEPTWTADINGPIITMDQNKFAKYLAGVLIYYYRSQSQRDDYLFNAFTSIKRSEAKAIRYRMIEEEKDTEDRTGIPRKFITDEDAEKQIDELKIKNKAKSGIKKLVFRLFDAQGNPLENPSMIVYGFAKGQQTENGRIVYGDKKIEICTVLPKQHKRYQISIDDLYKFIIKGQEYIKTATPDNYPERTDTVDFTDTMQLAIPGLIETLNSMAKQFTKYYDYLIELKEEIKAPIDIDLERDLDERGPNPNPRPDFPRNQERKNDILPYEEDKENQKKIENYAGKYRRPILESNGLKLAVRINKNINDDMRLTRPASDVYTSEIDSNGGILIFIEPIEGDRLTRVAYCTPEKLKKIFEDNNEKNPNKKLNTEIIDHKLDDKQKIAIAKYFFTMTDKNFRNESNTILSSHTTIEAFKVLVQGICSRSSHFNWNDLGEYNRGNATHLTKQRLKQLGLTEIKGIAHSANPELLEEASRVLGGLSIPGLSKPKTRGEEND